MLIILRFKSCSGERKLCSRSSCENLISAKQRRICPGVEREGRSRQFCPFSLHQKPEKTKEKNAYDTDEEQRRFQTHENEKLASKRRKKTLFEHPSSNNRRRFHSQYFASEWKYGMLREEAIILLGKSSFRTNNASHTLLSTENLRRESESWARSLLILIKEKDGWRL